MFFLLMWVNVVHLGDNSRIQDDIRRNEFEGSLESSMRVIRLKIKKKNRIADFPIRTGVIQILLGPEIFKNI